MEFYIVINVLHFQILILTIPCTKYYILIIKWTKIEMFIITADGMATRLYNISRET